MRFVKPYVELLRSHLFEHFTRSYLFGHADQEPVVFQYVDILIVGLLHTLVWMMNASSWRLPFSEDHFQCSHCHVGIQSIRDRIPDHLPQEAVEEHRKLHQWDGNAYVGDVSDLNLVDSTYSPVFDQVWVSWVGVLAVRGSFCRSVLQRITVSSPAWFSVPFCDSRAALHATAARLPRDTHTQGTRRQAVQYGP